MKVTRADTLILGLGVPSLVPTKGSAAISVAEVDGETIAGLILDAGAVEFRHTPGGGPQVQAADRPFNQPHLSSTT